MAQPPCGRWTGSPSGTKNENKEKGGTRMDDLTSYCYEVMRIRKS